MDFSTIKAITIPEGNVTQITAAGVVLWKQKPSFTNLADPTSSDWGTDKRIGSDGTFRDCAGSIVTNFIEVKVGDVIRVAGIDLINKVSNANAHFVGLYTPSKVAFSVSYFTYHTANFSNIIATATGGQATVTRGYGGDTLLVRFGGKPTGAVDDIIITVNEEIV